LLTASATGIADIDVPLGAGLDSTVTPDPRFLEVRHEIEDLLSTV
jgi:hypothetical protein